MVNSSFFISPEVIQADLSRVYKRKHFDIDDIVEWCGIAETRYIKDIDLMCPVYEVPLSIVNGSALLPCNVYRLLDVYDGYGSLISFTKNSSGAYIGNFKYNGQTNAYTEDIIYINYMGTPVEETTGYPLIIKGHENACEMFCKIRSFEEDAVLGNISYSVIDRWENRFSGLLAHVAQNPYKQKTQQAIKELDYIRGDMFPSIGKVVLAHQKNKRGGTFINPRLSNNSTLA